jgi:hypothetical protein
MARSTVGLSAVGVLAEQPGAVAGRTRGVRFAHRVFGLV